MNYHEELANVLNIGRRESMVKGANPITTSTFSSTGGISQELADRFITLTRDESVLLKAVGLHRASSPSGEFTKLDVTGYITEQATEHGSSSETRKPVNTLLEYATKKTRSNFDITSEVSVDTVEGSRGSNVILDALIMAVKNNMELLSIRGDTSIGGSDDLSRLLKTNDGWNVLTTLTLGTHIKDAGAKRPSLELLRRMLMDLPTRYRTNLNELRWIMSANTVLDLVGEIQGRATALGDTAVQGTPAIRIHGIPILEIPLMPENLSVSGTDSTGTIIWLTNPKNFMYIVWQDLQVHQDFRPRTDTTEVTAYMRTDFLVVNTDAVVKATNVILDSTAGRFAAT